MAARNRPEPINIVEIEATGEREHPRVVIDGVDVSGSVVAITAVFAAYERPRIIVTMDARHVKVKTLDQLVDLCANTPVAKFERLVKRKAEKARRKKIWNQY